MQILVLKHVDQLLTNIRGFLQYASRTLLKYQIYIRIHSPNLVNSYNILYKSPHSYNILYKSPHS